jgi:hypothetical protein
MNKTLDKPLAAKVTSFAALKAGDVFSIPTSDHRLNALFMKLNCSDSRWQRDWDAVDLETYNPVRVTIDDVLYHPTTIRPIKSKMRQYYPTPGNMERCRNCGLGILEHSNAYCQPEREECGEQSSGAF